MGGRMVLVGSIGGAPVYTPEQWSEFLTALLSIKPGDAAPGIVLARLSDGELREMGFVPVAAGRVPSPAGE